MDIHGPHEHQSLLRTGTHIDLLDDFGGLEGLAGEFRDAYDRAEEILNNLRALRAKELTLKDRATVEALSGRSAIFTFSSRSV